MGDAAMRAFINFDPRPVDAEQFARPRWRQQLAQQIAMFPSFALPAGQSPVALCGFVHSEGVCEAWMVTGRGFEGKARTILQQQRALIADMFDALSLRRMHIMVDVDRADAQRWAEALGFSFEARLDRLGVGDRDQYVYRILAKGKK